MGILLFSLNYSPQIPISIDKVDTPKPTLVVQNWANKYHFLVNENDLQMAYQAGIQNNVDPLLILSIIGVESAFKATAKSNAGAVGYLQVVPKWHMNKISDVTLLLDPEYNIHVGTRILAEYISNSSTLELALQKYNGSRGSKKYSDKVLSHYNQLLVENTKQ